ncbi:MAG: peptide ABC transporter substrate-binding protein [Verrucomicrobia bacterium]|nr:peptide ABC transporter substrate-binding protein [Verrucomicrobiota bacterium]
MLLLAALLAAGCGRRDPAVDAAPGQASAPQLLRLRQRNEPVSLDPASTALPDEFGILRSLLEGLLLPGPNGGPPEPGAALRHEVSADGLVYTFHLRPDGRWSDGRPVTAADFVASARRLLTPATAAPKANVYFAVQNARAFATGAITDFSAVGLRARDERTLVITLEWPNPRFPATVASGPWLPVRTDVVERHGRHWTQPGNFVGNGPFVLAEWRADQRVVVRRNPRWRDAASVRVDEIHFVRFDNGDSEDRAYRAGQIDATMAVPFSKVPAYARERPQELHRLPMIETRYLAFNTRLPALGGSARLALALAIDRERLTERVLQGGQSAAHRFLPPPLRTPESGTGAPHLSFNPAEARRLLAAAGYPGGKGFPRLELSGWTHSQALEAIQQMWRTELGIEVAIVIREAKVHLDALRTGHFEIAFATAIPDVADPAAMLGDFLSGAPLNYPRWSHAGYDAAVQAGDYAKAERHLLEESPIAPLYFNSKVFLLSPRVQGWQEDGLWARVYQGMSVVAPGKR